MTQKMIHLGSVLLIVMLLAALTPAARAQALQPCSIAAIDARAGVVSAKVNASGAAFQFRVTDAALLKSLKVGQEVYANFTTKQVSLDGKRILGEIISSNAPPPPPLPPAGGTSGNSPASPPTKTNPPPGSGGATIQPGEKTLRNPSILTIPRGTASGAAPPASAAQPPAISPAGGTYNVAQLGSGVTIADSTAGAVIHYTTDGSTPTASSAKYSGPIPVSSTTTIKALATASGMTNSAITTTAYIILSPTCPAGSVTEGVDVTEYQGAIDWKKVRASGRAFAYARASVGTSHMDATFVQNYAAIKAAGLLRGALHTLVGEVDGVTQADYFLTRIGTLQPGDLPPALDASNLGTTAVSTFLEVIGQWMTRVQAATGRTPIVYSNASELQQALGSGTSADRLWIANWGVACPTLPAGAHQWVFWQYSSTGTVPGIPGAVDAVDLNRFNGNLAGLNALAKPSTSHQQASSATGQTLAGVKPLTSLPPATMAPAPAANQPGTGPASTSSAATSAAAPATAPMTAKKSPPHKPDKPEDAQHALTPTVATPAAQPAGSAQTLAAATPAAAPVAVGAIQNKLAPATPCCNITAMDTNTGVVTATENATNKVFQFKLNDPTQLKSLNVGKGVYANFAANVVSMDGLSPNGIILSTPAAPAATSGMGVGTTPVSSGTLRDEKTTKPAPGATSDAARPAGSAKTLAAAEPASVVQNIRQLGALPQLSYGTPQPAPSGPRGMPARWEASGTYMHIRGYDGIEQAQGLPEGVKTLLKIHVMALEPGEPDHYLVNPQLALEWSKTHPVPPEVKPPSTSDGHSGCSAWSIHCGGEVVKHAEDETSRQAQMLRQQAQADWKHWGTELTKDWHEAEGCLADNTLPLNNIPIEFAASPSVGIHLERSGKITNGSPVSDTMSGSASGKAEGTVNLALPMNSPDFRANLEVFYIPCLPFMVRPKSIGGHGTVTVGSRLTAAVKATGQFDENISTGSAQVPIVLIPIVLFGVPIAEMEVSAYVEGNIEVSGQGAFTANFALDNPHEMKLEFSCDGHGCTGHSQPVPVPTIATETAQLNGRIRVEPTIFTAVQLDFDFGALTARAGPQPYLLGEIYGCVGAAASQNLSNESSTAQEWHGLTADVDWGVDLRGQVLMAEKKVFDKTLHGVIKKNTHIWFKDLWPGGSNALYPLVDGAAQASMSTPALYQIKMPACYPYPDKVNYQLAWTGGATASMGASGTTVGSGVSSATLATRGMVQQGARLNVGGNGTLSPSTSTSATCNLQSGQGTCEFDPVKSFGIDLLWPVAGANNVTVTAVSDTHGRAYKSAQPTSVNVTVQ